jgi:hypothetical protein
MAVAISVQPSSFSEVLQQAQPYAQTMRALPDPRQAQELGAITSADASSTQVFVTAL